MTESPELTVIFPAYNEQEGLEHTIRRAMAALDEVVPSYEILIVNDCSRDATGKIADRLASEHPSIRVLHNSENLRQGGSLLKAFPMCRGRLIVHNGVDYPFDLLDLRLMLPLMEHAHIVVAARATSGGQGAYRVVISGINRALLRLLFGLPISDYNFVQLYRREIMDDIRPDSASTGFLTPEMLIRAHDLGYQIREVTVPYHPRVTGVATAGRPAVIYQSLRDLLRFWWRRRAR